jgi:2'-5' RNA ligase
MPENNLYFIAVIPFRDLRDKVNELKRDIATRFNSARALKVMPHITLKAPFKWPPTAHNMLLKWFVDLKLPGPSFAITLQGFGAFNNRKNPVIFIKPADSISLVLLQRELVNSFAALEPAIVQPIDKNFTPHMTIAYRDLTPANFEKAWEEYSHKEFEEQFEINAVHLLQHNGRQWNIMASKALANT